MSKKLFRTLCALALGVGAGLGITALLEQKRRCCIDKDRIATPVSLKPAQAEDECAEQHLPSEESDAERGQRIIRNTLEGVGERFTLSYFGNAHHIKYVLEFRSASAAREALEYADDIALNLRTPVRTELLPDIPGALILEVARKDRELLRYGALKDTAENSLEVPLGVQVPVGANLPCDFLKLAREDMDNVVYCNLTKMPHLLMAGTTGSGKSVAVNVILTGLVEKNYPEDLRLVLIDPKQIEFSAYEKLPHLLAPIVTSPRDALATLKALLREMENRFEAMKKASVRNLVRYNEKMADMPEKHMPYIVAAVDELADLAMSEYGGQIENILVRLAQKGRSAGIHLILGTQRPTEDVLTGHLKVSFPSRMAFAVRDAESSRYILDMNGAETLAGRGDMLYMTAADRFPWRVQCAYLSEGEMEERFASLQKALPALTYDEDFCALLGEELAALRDSEAENETGDTVQDPLFTDALKLFVENDKVATSLLQRRLAIGYSRAAKIVDRMEALGLITSYVGNKPRKLLPAAKEYLEKMSGKC